MSVKVVGTPPFLDKGKARQYFELCKQHGTLVGAYNDSCEDVNIAVHLHLIALSELEEFTAYKAASDALSANITAINDLSDNIQTDAEEWRDEADSADPDDYEEGEEIPTEDQVVDCAELISNMEHDLEQVDDPLVDYSVSTEICPLVEDPEEIAEYETEWEKGWHDLTLAGNLEPFVIFGIK